MMHYQLSQLASLLESGMLKQHFTGSRVSRRCAPGGARRVVHIAAMCAARDAVRLYLAQARLRESGQVYVSHFLYFELSKPMFRISLCFELQVARAGACDVWVESAIPREARHKYTCVWKSRVVSNKRGSTEFMSNQRLPVIYRYDCQVLKLRDIPLRFSIYCYEHLSACQQHLAATPFKR